MKGTLTIIVSVLVLALIASFPVWKQNKYHDLLKEQNKLKKELAALQSELQKREFEINSLSSRERIENLASEMNLGFYSTFNSIKEK